MFNTAIGYSALYSNQSGSSSTAIGLSALESNTTGDGNTSTGSQSLQANTTGYFNTADGYLALYENNGSCNTATGNRTLLFNITGNYNTGTGSYALFNNNGSNNTATGFEALYSNTTGGNNTVTGNLALYTTTGSNNTAFGYNAGYYSTGSGDVFIGYQAGYNETGSNKLYIDDSNTSSPLIWGDFSARLLNFNGNVGIGTTTPTNPLEMGGTDSKIYMNSANSNMLLFNSNGVALPSFTTRSVGTKIVLYPDVNSSWVDYAIGISNGSTWYSVPSAISTCAHRFFAGTTEILTILGNGNVGINNNTPGYKLTVNGTAWCSSGAWTGSDIRWKKNINEINDVLNNVLTLKPVTYQWKTNEFPEMNFTDGTQIGLMHRMLKRYFQALL